MHKETFRSFLCGLAMGAADVVPGVSGGTIAFMTGVYEPLLNALKSFDSSLFRLLLAKRWRDAFQRINWRFLFPLAGGVLLAILSLARLIHLLLQQWPDLLWGFFFGLILASIVLIGRKLPPWIHLLLFFAAGFLAAWHVSGMDALQAGHTPCHIFTAGFIALCAMILPGISGSFMLVLMGQYAFILQAVIEFNLATLLLFACGGLCGLLSFSRLLSSCFSKYPHQTNSVMLGIMAGCLRLAWPWQSGGMPAWPQALGLRECLVIAACVAGLALPIALHLIAQGRTDKNICTEKCRNAEHPRNAS